MTFIAAAVVAGAAVVGAVSSSRSSKRASKVAEDASEAEIAFAREQYDRWKEIYGPIEENLSNYYQQLTPELTATQGLQAFELERDSALEDVRATLDQRGIGTSGIAGQAELEIGIRSSEERARIRSEAPMKVAREKLGFLSAGLGIDPAGTLNSALSSQTAESGANSRAASRAAGEAVGAAVEPVADLAGQLADAFKNRETSGGT